MLPFHIGNDLVLVAALGIDGESRSCHSDTSNQTVMSGTPSPEEPKKSSD
jgi:hypothetical protein